MVRTSLNLKDFFKELSSLEARQAGQYKQTNRQPYKQTTIQTDNHTNRQPYKQTTIQTDNYINRQSCKQTTIQTDNHTNRQLYK
jgi:hypothetical protein